ncbi:MAG TPA: PAS domain-containing protein, partial [Calditrichia bacterium]|nr:PAS domain-containing protein [Calditrichia bacterium]
MKIMLASLPEPCFVLDRENRIRAFNEPAASWLEPSPGLDFLGFLEGFGISLSHSSQNTLNHLKYAFREKIEGRKPDGPSFWGELKAAPLADRGRPGWKTVIICDTTSWERQVLGQRKAEQALESWISDRTDELMEANFRLAEEGRRHRKTAEALKKSEQDFRLLYENAPLAYFTLDHLGIVRRLNKSARELMGNPTYPIKGRRFQSLFQN